MLKKFFIVFLIFTLLFSIAGCSSTNYQDVNTATPAGNTANLTQNESHNAASANTAGLLKVHFLDVGQGDSIFIQSPSGKTMLIDAGVPQMGNKVVNYLKNLGVKKIDILVGTHPHEDHIGGMDYVIDNFDIGQFYMPKVTTNTKTFEYVLNAARNKGLKIDVAKAGVSLDLGPEASAMMIAPNGTKYDDLNEYSAVIKLNYGDTSFLFTGDAGAESEKEMINQGYDLKSDVLKIGHHGSSTSTTAAFLDAVDPEYAVISCGKGNDYGHPHSVTLKKLKARNIPVYRTDECGTIVATSDGHSISFNVKPGDYVPGQRN
ncbi:ComEC/Rec2 family competence protein [Thermoanaerobacterium thermosaccharolyticum]|uniref:Putative hydrolase (Metallo-beta-lactamase superfamily) n=1 Tax=Thermoanaerobacterium thermosaccharolyticum M0795 TaxID=698948 RepID=L0ILH0_THETR|nr:ComEC/Rec2 family competence protein [Thermoanaerobacterium thermosaccharolyticum]AGB19619.1 putative hydrolase (metallo-beta-lactamase superfamily) [Thermoanaerobacterium thermosaccharolyticum M0795]